MDTLTYLEFRVFAHLFWKEMDKRKPFGTGKRLGILTNYQVDEIECCKRIALAKMKR